MVGFVRVEEKFERVEQFKRVAPSPPLEGEPPAARPPKARPPLGRVGAVIAEQFEKPLGLEPSDELILKEIGIFAESPEEAKGVFGPFFAFNRVAIKGGAELLDLAVRGLTIGISVPIAAGAELLRAFGVSDKWAQTFEGAVHIGLLRFFGEIPTGVPRVPRVPKAKAPAVEKAVTEAADIATRKLPEGVRQEAADAAVAEVMGGLGSEALLASARGKIGPPTLGQIDKAAKMSFFDRLNTEVLDAVYPIKEAAIRGARKEGIEPDLSPYKSMRRLAGIRGTIEAIHTKGAPAFSKKEGGLIFATNKGLNEIFRPAAGDLDGVSLYFVGRRAQELLKQGRERLFTPAEIREMVALGEKNPAFKQIWKDYREYDEARLAFMVQAEVLSSEAAARILAMNRDHVPFWRMIEGEEGFRVIKGGLFKRLKGAEANIAEVLETIYRNDVMMNTIAITNLAKVKVYNMIEELGLSDIATRMKRPPEGVRIADEKIARLLEESGAVKPGQSVQAFTFNKQFAENVDMIFRDGKREFWEIHDPIFFKAVTEYSPKSYGLALKTLGGFKMVLTRGVTLSPDFMAVNLIRDTQTAFVQSEAGFIPGWSSARGMVSRILKDDNYWQAMLNGAGFATLYKGEVGAGRNLRNFYASRGINYNKVLDAPRKIAGAAEAISSAFELSARLEEFRRLRVRGASLEEAAFGFREVSTDFAMRGQSDVVRFFTTGGPFLNAGMQGLARGVRAAKSNPARLALKSLTVFTLPTLALYYYNRNDPRYKALPDWMRDLHWVIFTPGSDEPFLIPRGFEYGALFAAVPERMMEFIETLHGKQFADRMLAIVVDQLRLDPIPQALNPLLEQATNETFFTGAPIVPEDLVDVRPSEQFRPWTSETMIALARAMREETGVEISPQRAEALIRGYFGTLGMYALEAADFLTRSVTDAPEIPTPRLDEIPVVRRFFKQQPFRRTQFEADFYELLTETRMVAATVARMLKDARDPNLTEEEKQLFGLSPAFDQIAQTISAANRQMRLIQIDKKLSGPEKRKRIDAIRAKMNELFEKVMRAVPEEIMAEFGFQQLAPPSRPAPRPAESFERVQ